MPSIHRLDPGIQAAVGGWDRVIRRLGGGQGAKVLSNCSGNAFLWVLVAVSVLLLLTVGWGLFQSSFFKDGSGPSEVQPRVRRFKIEIPPDSMEGVKPGDDGAENISSLPETLSEGDAGLRIHPEPAVHEPDTPAKDNGTPMASAPETPGPQPVPPPSNEDQATGGNAEVKHLSPETAPLVTPQPETVPIVEEDLPVPPDSTPSQAPPAPPPSVAPEKPTSEAPAHEPPGKTAAISQPVSSPPARETPAPVVPPPKSVPRTASEPKSALSPESEEPAGGQEQATVSVVTANARRKPSTRAGLAFQLHRGDTVTVLETRNKWYRIQDDQQRIGWVHRQLLGSGLPTEPTPAEPASAVDSGHITRIELAAGSMGGDILIFHIDRDRPPKTTVIEGDHPRIVCDFPDTSLDSGLIAKMPGHGETVEKIRSGVHGPPESKIRVVMDLYPNANYAVRQIYDRANKRYILHILPKKDTSAAAQ